MFCPVLSISLSILLIISVTAAEDIESGNHAESTTYSHEMWKKLHPDIKWNSKHANNVHVGGWGNLGDDNSKLIPNKNANADEYLSTENIKSSNHAESTTYSNEMWKKLHPDIIWNSKHAVGGWGDYSVHNLTVGYKTYQDRLLYSGAITKPYRFFRIVETDVVVHAPYGFIISFIEANATNSRADNAGYANIKAGGIGRRNVTLHLESARNNDLKYFVRVYGR